MINRKVVAIFDASVHERSMTAYWIIITLEESGKYVKAITSIKLVNGTIPEVEGLGILNLVRETNYKRTFNRRKSNNVFRQQESN